MSLPLINALQRHIEALDAQGLRRRRRTVATPCAPWVEVDGRRMLGFNSNDYLGLASHPQVVEALRQGASLYGTGSGGSHLIGGHSRAHAQLEDRLAALMAPHLSQPRALYFCTGYMANLGAIVRANDTRAEVADQVKSLGGEFVKVDYEEEGSGGGGYAKVMSEGFQQAQREMYAKQAREADIIITTALIPGKPAPKLISADMVKSMKPGSVIVDMAGEQGGNCELTVPGEAVVRHGVTIIGYTDLASRLAKQSSTLYATNLLRLTEELCKTKDGNIDVNMDDDAIRGLTVIKDGAITWPAPPPKLPAAAPAKPAAAAAPAPKAHGHGAGGPMAGRSLAIVFGIGAVLFWLVGAYAPAAFLSHFTVFVLACFVGYMVVWNVTPSLHTPLMSVTNAISSIIAIGALVQVAPPLAGDVAGRPSGLILALAVVSLALTAINMFGGFAVTRRMLAMFRK